MELFERVRSISKILEKDGYSLAEEIGVNIHTFRAYLKKDRQANLWPLLDLILLKHPELSREWLYFGEGRMLRSDAAPQAEAPAADLDPEQELQALHAELARLKDENYRLMQELVEEQRHSLELYRNMLIQKKF